MKGRRRGICIRRMMHEAFLCGKLSGHTDFGYTINKDKQTETRIKKQKQQDKNCTGKRLMQPGAGQQSVIRKKNTGADI